MSTDGAAPAEPPMLVGRARELEIVSGRFATPGAVTLLVGAGGIGKTTVLEGAVSATDDSLTVLRATATDLQVGVPFAAVADLGRFEAGRLAGVMRELAAVSGRSGPIDPFTNVLLVVDALADSLTTAAPAAIVIDDGQWIDAPSLTVLDRLLPLLSDVGASLTMAMRPDSRRDLASFVERARRHGGVSLDLGPLGEDAAIEILRRARPGADDAELAEVVADAAGNPLFLTELAHTGDGGTAGAPSGADGFRSSVRARLHQLPDESVRAMQAAAVIGTRFDVGLLASELDRSEIRAYDDLRPAIAAGLVDDTQTDLRFRHALVRQALLDDLPGPVRRSLHRSIAATADDALAVVHLELAGAPFAETDLDRIADRALVLMRVDARRSAELFELVLAHRDDTAARAGLVRALLQAGEVQRARTEISHLTNRTDELAAGLALLEVQGAVDEAEPDLIARLWEVADRTTSGPELAATQRLLAYQAMRADPVRFADLVTALDTDQPDLSIEARIDGLLARSTLAGIHGDLETAIGLATRAEDMADDDVVGPAAAIRAALTLGVFGGDLAFSRPAALAALDRATRLAEDGGHSRMVPSVHAIRANALWADRRWDDAEAAYRTAATTARDVKVPRWEAEAYTALSHMHADRGMPDEATEFIEACRSVVGDTYIAGAGRDWVSFEALYARRSWGSGDDDGAVAHWMADLRHPEARPFAKAVSGLDLTVASLAAGDAGILEAVAEVLEPYRGAGPPVGLALPLLDAARAGDVDAAVDAAEFGRAAPAYGFARGAEITGLVARAQGDTDTAIRWLTDARDTWADCGADGLRRRTDELLSGLGVSPAPVAVERPTLGWEALTDAEARVVALVAEGLLYREVADRLYVSRRTVETHVASALRKLELRNRAELAAEYWRRNNPA